MNKAELLFSAIDVLGYIPQNSVHYKNVACVKNISYSNIAEDIGDLYFNPTILSDGKKHPVIVYYHGGGFIKGDKKYRVSVSEYYADKGYFVYNVNYRMPPEVVQSGIIADCITALNFLPKLAEKYAIDLDNIVLTGDSSGAYIASYLAAVKYNDFLREKFELEEIKVDFKGVMLMCGIYDIDVLLKGTTLLGVIPETASMLLDFPFAKDLSNATEYEYYEYISPMKFVNDKWCSTFICWADDDLICQGQGEPMAEILKECVPLFASYHCKGILNNHCYHLMLRGSKYAKECMSASVKFLEELFSKDTVKA